MGHKMRRGKLESRAKSVRRIREDEDLEGQNLLVKKSETSGLSEKQARQG